MAALKQESGHELATVRDRHGQAAAIILGVLARERAALLEQIAKLPVDSAGAQISKAQGSIDMIDAMTAKLTDPRR